jgi:hypothetical protein
MTTLFGSFTALLFGSVIFFIISNCIYLSTHTSSSGEIIRNVNTTPDNSKIFRSIDYFQPILSYTTKDGKKLEQLSKTQSDTEYALGTIYPVMYKNSDPKEVDIYDFRSSWGKVFIFLIVGLMFAIISYYCYKSDLNKISADQNLRPIETVDIEPNYST